MEIDEACAATVLSAKLDESWARRKFETDAWNACLEKGLISHHLSCVYLSFSKHFYLGMISLASLLL